MNFVKKVQIFIEKYHMIKKDEHVLAGVSGGADSVCLLLVLHRLEKEMGFSLEAVHVEHGIRGVESFADAVFVEKLCGGLGIPFQKFSVNALEYAEETHKSVEEAARELRYGCFAGACAKAGADKIAVAHHANDNAETMLFHLARGTGIRGLGGIAPVVSYAGKSVRGAAGFLPGVSGQEISVIRPLLGVTRAEIEDYLDACGQTYCIDSTNADMAYARNRIRGHVLPELCRVNGQAVAHMGKTAGQLREICEYLEEAARKEGADAYKVTDCPPQTEDVGTDGSPMERIHVFSEPFLRMHRVLQTTLLHDLIGRIAGSKKDVTSGHVQQVLELFSMQEGKRTDLPYGVSARRLADGVELYRRSGRKTTHGEWEEKRGNNSAGENEPERADMCFDLPVPGELILKNGAKIRAKILQFDGNFEKIPKKRYTKWMDYDKIKGAVRLRTRRPGDYLQIDAEGGRKKLKRYFIDEKIPAKEREGTLLAADGSYILWVIGHRISEACKVTNETRRVLCLEYFTEESDGREN